MRIEPAGFISEVNYGLRFRNAERRDNSKQACCKKFLCFSVSDEINEKQWSGIRSTSFIRN